MERCKALTKQARSRREEIASNFFDVVCDHHKWPHQIASFHRLGGYWQEVKFASKDRRIEQKRKVADNGARKSAGVGEDTGGEAFDAEDWFRSMVPDGDRPGHEKAVVDGEPMSPTEAAMRGAWVVRRFDDERPIPKEWRTIDLTCPRCRRRKQHATYQRRMDELFAIFTELADDHGVTEVTPEFLSKFDNLKHNRRRSSSAT